MVNILKITEEVVREQYKHLPEKELEIKVKEEARKTFYMTLPNINKKK